MVLKVATATECGPEDHDPLAKPALPTVRHAGCCAPWTTCWYGGGETPAPFGAAASAPRSGTAPAPGPPPSNTPGWGCRPPPGTGNPGWPGNWPCIANCS